MGKTNTTIEINGKLYNAKTGAAIDAVTPKSKPKKAASKPAAPLQNRTIAIPTMSDVVRRKPGQHTAAHTPKPSQTLMRTSVKKPGAPLKRQVKAQGHMDMLAKPTLASVSLKRAAKQYDEARLEKAKRTPKSHHVQRFSKTSPEAYQAPHPQVKDSFPPRQVIAPPKPPKTRSTADLLEQALQNASGHQQPAHELPVRRTLKRNLSLTAAVGAGLVLVGIIGFQSLPSIRLHMASAKAGFAAASPAYHPAGYSLGAVHYSAGNIASEFKSNSNDGHYSIIQNRSNWDSEALLDNFVKVNDMHYQSVEVGGRTIYLYGKRSATWVNSGVWYQIQSDGSLSDHQLVELATSF